MLLAAVVFSGCGGAGGGQSERPPGLVRMWGAPGRIDGCFVKPRVIDVLPDGRVVVIDRSGRVQLFTAEGEFSGKFQLEDVEEGYPTGMDVGPGGNLWIAETHAFRVGVYTPEGEEVLAFGSNGKGEGEFIYVSDVEVAPDGSVYACDYGNTDRVQRFDLEGNYRATIGGRGTEPGRFRRPEGLASLPDASLLVADSVNHRIQKFSPGGELLAAFGESGSGQGQLLYPYDLALTQTGDVIIAEYGNNRLQRMSPDGEFLGTWGSQGGGPGELLTPWGVAVRGARLYVLDTGNSRVLELDLGKVEWERDSER